MTKLEKILKALETCIQALHNVPEVGSVYDQQHSDTQTAAILAAEDAILRWEEKMRKVRCNNCA